MPLLIGSIYAKGNSTDLEWLQIQKHFLESTTQDYDLVGVIPRPVRQTPIFNHINVIEATYPINEPLDCHLFGLRILKAHFELNKDRYDRFLILDSDAFPIKQGWQEKLEFVMKRLVGQCDIACAIRCELLETRLHASILYAKPESLPHLNFSNGYIDSDGPRKCLLTGRDDQGIFLPHYEGPGRDRVLPLLKSNRHTEGLLVGSVYYDLFYHHGAGSRLRQTRARAYWKHLANKEYWKRKAEDDGRALKQSLLERPDETIAKLAGWSDGQYGAQKTE